MSADTSLDVVYLRWAEGVQRRGLTTLALPLLELLQTWRELGIQLLWLAAPLIDSESLDPWIVALEDPQILRRLQRVLREGGA